MIHSWKSRKGAALVTSIGILAVLTILGLTFSQLMVVEREASANHSDGVRAKFAAQAGVEYATSYLRKLARVRQHSDPVGDMWAWDPFYTDDQGRPVFDGTQSPAWPLGAITDPGGTAATVTEEYSGYVHATYYETPGVTPAGYPTPALPAGAPGNYFQLKVQSCASQIYLNAHQTHLPGTENLLTNFMRATVENARTHMIPQATGGVAPGRAFFAGLNTDALRRALAREILRRRLSDLPGGLFSTKEQLLQILQNIETAGTVSLGTGTSEQVYHDFKHFVTIHAWEDDSVLNLHTGSASGIYAGSVPNGSLFFQGSNGGTRDPAPVARPYMTFVPSRVSTYYSCRELTRDGEVIGGRAPIDINAAPEEVLTAVFAGLTADRTDLAGGVGTSIPFPLAQTLARDIVLARTGASTNPVFNTYHSTFYSWDHFYGFLNTHPALTHNQTDLIKAMCNPNTDINKFNPDTTLRRRFDKGDIRDNAGIPSFTTELCFGSMGYYDIISVGKILGTAGVTTGVPTRAAIAARQTYNSVVRVYEVFRDTTQRDFETDRDFVVGVNDAPPALPGIPADAKPVDVYETSVISIPESRQNTQIQDPGTDPAQDRMRPRRVDDTGNDAHSPINFGGNEVHAAEYDGQLALNGMINAEYFQSDDGGAFDAGFSNAQWAPYMVEGNSLPNGQAFPIPVATLAIDLTTIPFTLTFVYSPFEFNASPVDLDIIGDGNWTDTGFGNYVAEGRRSLICGFNTNDWAPNVPVRRCAGSFGSIDPVADFGTPDPGRGSSDYPLSDIVNTPGAGGTRTMRDGQNMYPLGFNPRAHAALSGSDSFSTYLRYHNGNVHRFEGTVSVWVKPDHDFTRGPTHDLHRGTLVAFRNGYSHGGTISFFGPGGGGINNAGLPTEVISPTLSGPVSFSSDDFISNAFIIRFDSAYSMRAAIWGNNHFEGVDYPLLDGFPFGATTSPKSRYGSATVRTTPQVFATESVAGSTSGNGPFNGIRCVPGKWQIVQIFYQHNPPINVPPFEVIPAGSSPENFHEGTGYCFRWSLPAKNEVSNIASVSQPGVGSWPNGSDPTWPAFSGPIATSPAPPGLASTIMLNGNYHYCSTVWEDNYKGILGPPGAGPLGPLDKFAIFYIPAIYPPDPFPAYDTPESRRRSRWIFGAFMSAAASIRAEASTSTMAVPGIYYGPSTPGPHPNLGGDSAVTGPIASVDAIGLEYQGRWFGDSHPDWFDGRFKRTTYFVAPSSPQLQDIALGGGVGTAGLSPTNLGTNWDLPGTSGTDNGLAYATIDNFQIHPFDASHSRSVVDSSAGTPNSFLGVPLVEAPVTPGVNAYPFNDMQKRYWDNGHRFGVHSAPSTGHGFTGVTHGVGGPLVAHGVYKKYCRQIAQDAITFGGITIGQVAFTTYSGNLPDFPSGWTDTTNIHNADFARVNMDPGLSGIERLEYVSYLGSSGELDGLTDVLSPFNVSVRIWKDQQRTPESAAFVCDFEFIPAPAQGKMKAEEGGTGGASHTMDMLVSGPIPDEMLLVTLTGAEASAGSFISYSAGLNSDTLHAVAAESPFLDDVTITYLLPNAAYLRYMEILD